MSNPVTKTDVIICGSGSAGLCAAVWLARLGIDFRILEKRDGPLRTGQADGVQCRTVEVFESFGLDAELKKDAYWVNEVVFWTNFDNESGIQRVRRTADVLPGISWQPHIILNQARLNDILIKEMTRCSGRAVDYSTEVTDVKLDSTLKDDRQAFPVTAIAVNTSGGKVNFQAKYLLGCDGAHSKVRKSLGFKMVGETSDALWGVMDIFPRTNFPDIRKKTSIRSASGNLLIIPREGGSMARFYIELPHGTIAKNVTLEDLQKTAMKIFSPFEMDFAHTHWWSAYSIGQRLIEQFSKDDRIFLTGDASHTHSPKAGQGMNLSLQDGYNIGWKLGLVLNGLCNTDLLKTYTLERGKTAADLIAFDRELTSMLKVNTDQNNADALKQFSDHFVRSAKYMAGLTTRYQESIITSLESSDQSLASNVEVGMRFPSAQVVRLCDARALQIAQALTSDGRFRLIAFPGDISEPSGLKRFHDLARFLTADNAPIRSATPENGDPDSVIETVSVLHGSRVKLEDTNTDIPTVFMPITGKWKMRDVHKIYIDDQSYNNGYGNAYQTLGINPKIGALVVIRPDQYVSLITSFANMDRIRHFFSNIFRGEANNSN